MPYFRQRLPNTQAHVLDVGAGHGAFSKEIHELGYQVTACDFAPEIFYYDKPQSTSRWLMFLYPVARLYTRLKKLLPIHNDPGLLTGRVLFLQYTARG